MKSKTLRISPRAAVLATLCASFAPTALAQVAEMTYGPVPNQGFGASVALLGDVNGDGYPEYVVGAPSTSGQGAGAAYVIDGRFHYSLWMHEGLNASSRFGHSVAGGVDWNGDGIPDYAVGAPRTAVQGLGQVGMVRIFSGKDGSVLQTYFGTQNLADFGDSVAFLADVDGDGRVDLAVAAPGMNKPNDDLVGRVRLYSGATGLVLRDVWGPIGGGQFGRAMTSVGDWNGDGVPDLAISAPFVSVDHDTGPGVVRVVSGATGATLHHWYPVVAQSNFGLALASIADRDGDGRRELVVGAPNELGIGAVHVITSATKAIAFSQYGQAPAAYFGSAVAGVGDIDGDGFEDFTATSPGTAATDALRIFSGATGQSIWAPLKKPQGHGWFGGSISVLGDADGDGWRDVLVGDLNAKWGAQTLGGAFTFRLALHQADLGFQGPGYSKLSVHGKPLGLGGWADLELKVAGAGRPGVLVASPWQNPTPIFGGTLVPTLDGLLIPYVTNADGKFHLKGIPGGLGLFSIYCQAVTKNPNTPHGWGFSNAVRVDFSH